MHEPDRRGKALASRLCCRWRGRFTPGQRGHVLPFTDCPALRTWPTRERSGRPVPRESSRSRSPLIRGPVMKMKSKFLIWMIAAVTAGAALYIGLPINCTLWWQQLQLWIQDYPFWLISVAIISSLIPIFKLVAAYGLYKLRNWGRMLAIYTLSTDFLIRLAGFINQITYYWRHPEMVQRDKELLASALANKKMAVIHINLIPGYIIAISSLICVILLFLRPVKEVFRTAEDVSRRTEIS